MKPKNCLAILFVLLFSLSNSFGQTHPFTRYLPENTSMVMHIDLVRLASKAPWAKIKESEMFKQMTGADSPLKNIFSSPLTAGIDYGAGLMVIISKNEEEGREPLTYLLGKVSNVDMFTHTINSLKGKDKVSISQYGTDRMILSDGPTLAWNNNVFVIPFGNKGISEAIMPDFSDTTDENSFSNLDFEEELKKAQRGLCFELLAPKSTDKFSADLVFNDLLRTSGDIKFWTTGSGNMMGDKFAPMNDLLKELEDFTSGTKTALINFEAGKIVATSLSYPTKTMAELHAKYPFSPFDAELAKRLPKGKLLGIINSSYNSGMLNEVLERKTVKSFTDSIGKLVPFDLNLLKGAVKDKFMIAAIQTDENNSKEGIQVFVAMPVADRSKLESLGKRIKSITDSLAKEKTKNEEGEDEGTNTKEFFGKKMPSVKFNDQYVVLALTDAAADLYLNGTDVQALPAEIEKYQQYPMVAVADLKAVLSMVMKSKAGNEMGEGENRIMNVFDKIVAYGGNFENGNMHSAMEFRFTDTNENALGQLFELINMMGSRGVPFSGRNDDHRDTSTIQLVEITLENEEKPVPPPPPPPPPKQPKKVEMKKFTPPVKKEDKRGQ